MRTILVSSLILFAAWFGGCGGGCKAADTREDVARVVASGFEKEPSRIFRSGCDPDRVLCLLAYLGYNAKTYSHSRDHSSDGTSLRCWNRDRTSAVVITKGQKPRVINTPPWAQLDDRNEAVAWGDLKGEHMWTFQSGKVLFVPNLCLGGGGPLFLFGGPYYDNAAGKMREAPIAVASLEEPEKTLVASKLTGPRPELFAANDAIYIVVRAGTADTGGSLAFEEYARQGQTLAFKRQFEVRSPDNLSSFITADDFDPLSHSFLISAVRTMPLTLLGEPAYLYDATTGKLRKLGSGLGYTAFLDRHIFDEAIGVDAKRQ